MPCLREQYKNIIAGPEAPCSSASRPTAHWNPERDALEFTIEIGEYRGVVHIRRHVFRRFLDGAVTPERCLEVYHLQRASLELVVERKLRQRQLTEDGNVEVTGSIPVGSTNQKKGLAGNG